MLSVPFCLKCIKTMWMARCLTGNRVFFIRWVMRLCIRRNFLVSGDALKLSFYRFFIVMRRTIVKNQTIRSQKHKIALYRCQKCSPKHNVNSIHKVNSLRPFQLSNDALCYCFWKSINLDLHYVQRLFRDSRQFLCAYNFCF